MYTLKCFIVISVINKYENFDFTKILIIINNYNDIWLDYIIQKKQLSHFESNILNSTIYI